ncbi:MAG: DUF362 domain-containing protein [Defluviitaleaceae bacterium]|nr:DUF362 domain-containing protein [Defluviitaleaceae bacterium]
MLVTNFGTDIAQTVYEALGASDICDYLKPNFSVAIKPNLVAPRPASDGATTHPEAVEGILRFLQEFGISPGKVSIIESSQIGDDTRRAFANCGYEPLVKKYGVSLFDLKQDSCTVLEFSGTKVEICNRALETDFLINVPVLKAHCQTNLTCTMKNLKGCIPDREKRRFHTIGLHRPIAALNALVKTGYCVVDGICGDLTFEEGGNPTYANRIVVGRDPVLVDSFCAEIIGYYPTDIEYLNIAKNWGLGGFFSPDTNLIELNTDKKPRHSVAASRLAARYEKNIHQDGACSACYAALIHALHRASGSDLRHGEICIGQGFREKPGGGLGIGDCTRHMSRFVPGCPPRATDIISALE